MVYKVQSPICLITFNRPDHTEEVLRCLRDVEPAKLYVVRDGPRLDRAGESEACEKVKKIVEECVAWDCEIFWKVRSENAGCRKNVSEGITWFFEQEEEGIILEDDCVPDISFFRYCDELLERYRNEPRIVCISGSCFAAPKLKNYPYSYYFSIFNHCWGWASWSRAWQYYESSMDGFDPDQCMGFLCDEMQMSRKHAEAWVKRFASVAEGRLNTWDYIWTYSCWLKHGLTCLPTRNLVKNIGFDELATHTQQGYNVAGHADHIGFPLEHPSSFELLRRADTYVQNNIFTRSLLTRVKQKISRQLLSRLGRDRSN